jgi:hypothetical protein
VKEKLLYLFSSFKVDLLKYSEIQNQNLDYLFLKSEITASYFDSHKTNTEIDLIPIESKQLNTPFYQSVRKNY